LTAGWNLIVAPKHSLCSYHTVTISVIHTHSNRTLRTAPLQLNVRYYSTVWRFPPTYCTSTGLPTSTSNFPVPLRHPVYAILLSVQARYSRLCPIKSHSRYNSSSVTSFVVHLPVSKLKPLIFSVSGFTLFNILNMWIIIICNGLCLLPS
jgi:hypothetical protein